MENDETKYSGSETFDSDEDIKNLRAMRGNCSCHISPPCSYCCNPVTVSEAEDLIHMREKD